MSRTKKKISVFVVLTFILSTYFYYEIIKNGMTGLSVMGLMWMPAVGAIVSKLIFDKNIRNMGWAGFNLKYLAVGYLLSLFACFILYPLVWMSGLGGVDASTVGIFDLKSGIQVFASVATLGLIGSMITATGEEIGWRGFLVAEMMKEYSFTKTSIIISIIWNVYHLPIMIFAGYNNGISILSSFLCFTVSITAVCFIANWLRMKSNSVWPVVLLHSSHNLFVGSFFDRMTVNTGMTKLFTTEFGMGLAIIYTLVAIYFWSKRSEIDNVTADLG